MEHLSISAFETVSLLTYFLIMIMIGFYAYRKSTSDVSEYMLGGRSLHPAVGALSAGASDMSGWMLMGLPGAIYVSGFSAGWIVIGLLIGAYLNYVWVAPRLRVYTEVANDSITIPDFLENRFDDHSHTLRLVSALVIVIFFTVYTSSGIVAGGKLFESAFGLDYHFGIFAIAAVVLAYTVIGGFLAVSLTDFVQGSIMFAALIVVPIVTLFMLGGVHEVGPLINAANANATTSLPENEATDYFSFWPPEMTVLGVLSLLAWGLGYFGQPHIIVRFMAIRDLPSIETARWIGMSWMFVTVLGAMMVGLFGLAYVQNNELQSQFLDPETIFILLSQALFHPIVSGFLLAAILAAIMSTISSQLLVSSSSITEDLYKTFLKRSATQNELVLIGRIATIIVSLVAIALAINPDSNILEMVANAWAGFGSAFGPIILLSLHWKRFTQRGAMTGMLTGALIVVFWLYVPVVPSPEGPLPLDSIVYAMVPGFFLSGAFAILVSLMDRPVSAPIQAQFDRVEQTIRSAT